MKTFIDPSLTHADAVVLNHLLKKADEDGTEQAIKLLAAINNKGDDAFEPTLFTAWSPPTTLTKSSAFQSYVSWASDVVRKSTDVVFLTHIILYFTTSVPSAIYLYYSFSWPHALLHWMMQSYYCGPFTLLLHNHIHNNGVLSKQYAWFDRCFPYVLEPLMGHTWDSYFYHHVKHRKRIEEGVFFQTRKF